MNIDWQKTPRKLVVGTFTDRYGSKCSIQESSHPAEKAIWLGVDAPRIYYVTPTGEARDVRLPEGAECVSRMHLTQGQVAQLIPLLQYFLEHGTLSADGDLRAGAQRVTDLEAPQRSDMAKESA